MCIPAFKLCITNINSICLFSKAEISKEKLIRGTNTTVNINIVIRQKGLSRRVHSFGHLEDSSEKLIFLFR